MLLSRNLRRCFVHPPEHFITTCRIYSGSYIMDLSPEALAKPRPLVGVIQMTSVPNKDASFKQASALINRAKSRGAQMVFLPECFDYVGESSAQTLDSAEDLDGDIISRYKTLATEKGLWLSLGGFHEKASDCEDRRLYNTHLLISDTGELKASYRKTHLFDLDIEGGIRLKESDWTRPGTSITPPVETPVGKIGMAICYDIRFPELSTALTQQGAEILTYPSAFTVPTGMAHWEVLLRSRAIENQCYVIAAAQTGKHNAKRASYGHSMVVDPWGCVVAECQDTPGLCMAEIDLAYLSKRRIEMPVMLHRRHDLYGHIHTTVRGDIDEVMSYQFGQVSVPSSCVFYRSPSCIAFVNKKPVLPGHVLVAPIRCCERFSHLSAAETSDLFNTTKAVSSVIEQQYGGSSLTISIQDGPEAGQTVNHVHVHVLPRKKGDFKKSDDIYNELENHDKNVAVKEWRSDEDMAEEAACLRPLFYRT